jgi:hypothetical protein
MAKNGGFIRNILIWTYERGTIQYDIICALILAFIFFVPKSCFVAKKTDTSLTSQTHTSRPAPTGPSQHQ